MKNRTILLLFLLVSCLIIKAQTKNPPNNKALNTRSDTVDILNYEINLDFTDFATQVISGNCVVSYTPKMNGINVVNFDLLKLNIDSITSQNSLLTYTYNDTLLSVNLPTIANILDTNSITFYYNGSPQQDASGWGGFYFDANYAYNLGVGFDASPHNYGRVWFPCFDNFVERSTFQFNIITDNGRNAHCNGYLDTTYTIIGDTIMNSWKMDETIPTYLACVAVADYETVHQLFNGINNTIPVELVGRVNDTTNMKNSFINLEGALGAYENSYGPYMWNKIGYSLVPFSSGAMEHATNIAYPQATANGNKTYETLMAHEFSHHWWGDLVTCETAEDMWINEGMAVYSEHLFLEKIYDYETSLAEIKDNNKNVIQFTHLREGGFRAISGIPHQYTYGEHVYQKGGLVAHNMRAYMGDSLFFVGLKSITNNYQYKNINSSQFRDELTNATGVNMTNFFNDWVFAPGFSHFSIDSTQTTPNGSTFDITLFVQQKLRGATNFHNGTPLIVSFYDANRNKYMDKIVASGQYSNTTINIPFIPTAIIINENNKLNQARTDDQLIITNTNTIPVPKMAMVANITVTNISDTALLQIEHNWVAPDSIKNNTNNFRISSSRYWSFRGVLPSTFIASARLNYDGRSATGFLDLDLVPVDGDSIVLLYRKNASEDWTEYPYYTKTVYNNIAFGFVVIDSLKLGEYTFAIGETAVGIKENTNENKVEFKMYPNPTKDYLWIENISNNNQHQAKVYDLTGKIVFNGLIKSKTKINTNGWKAGSYILTISDNNNLIYNEKIIVN
jgi:aminopeptidase N